MYQMHQVIHLGSPSIASVSGSFTFHFTVVFSKAGLSSLHTRIWGNTQSLKLCFVYLHPFLYSIRISHVLSLCLCQILVVSDNISGVRQCFSYSMFFCLSFSIFKSLSQLRFISIAHLSALSTFVKSHFI